MAVNLVAPATHGYELVGLCGVDPVLMGKAKALQIQVTHSTTGTLKVMNSTATKTYGIVPFKGTAVSLLKEGKLGPASKESVKFQVEKLLKQAIDDVVTTEEDVEEEEPKVENVYEEAQSLYNTPGMGGPKVGPAVTLGTLLKKKVAEMEEKVEASNYKNAKATIGEFNPFAPKKKGASMAQVKLSDATELYQPVYGTSGGSIYFVAAIFEGLKVALRRSGGTLSLRAEGNMKKYSDALEDVGFSVKKDYASVHLSVDTDDLLNKTFGAVIGALGFQNIKMVGNPMEAK